MLQSLLLTGLGGLLAITGTLIGQHLHTRSNMRMREEDKEREDRYRIHSERLKCYIAFHLEFGMARPVLLRYSGDGSSVDARSAAAEARNAAWRAFVAVRIIGSPQCVVAARELMREITAIARNEKKFDRDQWSRLVLAFRTAARNDIVGADEALLLE